MREFFKGWRRKAGSMTLVMALALAGMWARSRVHEDTFRLRTSRSTDLTVEFAGSAVKVRFQWETSNNGPDGGSMGPDKWLEWNTSAGSFSIPILFPITQPGGWASHYGRFYKEGKANAVWIPYSTSVLVSTLLSAYLILWKPRKRAAP